MKNILEDKVLVLNRNLYPLCVQDVERSLVLLFQKKAVVMDASWVSYTLEEWSDANFSRLERAVRTSSRVYIAPEVIRLTAMDKVIDKKINLTSQNLFLRDDFTCMYCGITGVPLQVEHVIPKSRYKEFGLKYPGGWENLVTSCGKCNQRKDNRTPEEAGMKLLTKPSRPGSSLKFKMGRAWKPSWNIYTGK